VVKLEGAHRARVTCATVGKEGCLQSCGPLPLPARAREGFPGWPGYPCGWLFFCSCSAGWPAMCMWEHPAPYGGTCSAEYSGWALRVRPKMSMTSLASDVFCATVDNQ
jgi:hypothetical protein